MLRLKSFLAFAAFLGLLALPLQSDASVLTIGTPGGGSNAFPFGGPASGYLGTRYQQAYNAALFPTGPISITKITFFNSDNAGTISSANFDFFLSTTPAGVNALNTTNFASNLGADNALFASLSLAGAVVGTLDITGSPFLYNPANGDLLLDILRSNAVGPNLSIFLDAMNGNFGSDSSRAHNFGTEFASWGLVTQFTYELASATVPEPTSILIFGLCFGGLARGIARRKKA